MSDGKSEFFFPCRLSGSSILNSLFYLALGQLKPQQLHREEFLFKAAASKDFQSWERDSNQQMLTDLPASGPESVCVWCMFVFLYTYTLAWNHQAASNKAHNEISPC